MQLITETRLLKPVAQVKIPARTKPFNVAAFYRASVYFHAYDTFADHLDLSAKKMVAPTPERPYVASLLKANAYDTDIRKELPETHLSTLEDIAWLIEAQPGGQSGSLLNNGCLNIFYVEGRKGKVFTMFVRFASDSCMWAAEELRPEEPSFSPWPADSQVLCPSNAAL